MAHIAEMPIVRSMHGYVLCEYARTFQKTHFHPYANPAPSGIGNPVKIPDSKIRITFPDRVYGEDSI